MNPLEKLLNQYYLPQGGYPQWQKMHATPGKTIRQIARHFNDVDNRTVVRWRTMEREWQKQKEGAAK